MLFEKTNKIDKPRARFKKGDTNIKVRNEEKIRPDMEEIFLKYFLNAKMLYINQCGNLNKGTVF